MRRGPARASVRSRQLKKEWKEGLREEGDGQEVYRGERQRQKARGETQGGKEGESACGQEEPHSFAVLLESPLGAAGFQETRDVRKRVLRRPHYGRLAVRVLR